MLNFIIEAITKYKQIGTLLPSSPSVAKEIIKIINTRQNLRILEVGAGTGAITIPIIQDFKNYSQLDICEINSQFINRLLNKLSNTKSYRDNQKKINIINAPIQELDESNSYDVIICSLPLLNFSSDEVDNVIEKFGRLSRKGTILLYVECVGMRALRKQIFNKISIDKNDIAKYFSCYPDLVKTKRVWANCPPVDIIIVAVDKLCNEELAA